MTDTLMALDGETALAAGRQAPKIRPGGNLAHARETAQDFEAFFLGQMLQPMFAETNAEEPFGGGQAEQMWQSLQVDEFGKAFARAGGIGIADMVMNEILKMQEIQ